MIEIIVIIVLALAFICATCFCIFNNMKSAEEIARLDLALQRSNKELKDVQEHTYDVLKEWAESMDKHDKAYTELVNKNLKLESELELKNIEVERLKGIIKSDPNYILAKDGMLTLDEKGNLMPVNRSEKPEKIGWNLEDSTDGDKTIPIQSGV